MKGAAPALIIPAAGTGSRLGPLPHSKELVPVGADHVPVIQYLLDRCVAGGIERAQIITRPQKSDIAETLGRGYRSVQLDYLETDATPSAVHTIAVALNNTQAQHSDAPQPIWALGFPDILFEPHDAYRTLFAELGRGRDLVLGLFPTDRPDKTDMVEIDEAGRVLNIRIKQACIGLRYTWSIACWSHRFSELLLTAIASERAETDRELYVGDVILQALEADLDIATVRFPDGWALDVGTPDDLRRAQAILK